MEWPSGVWFSFNCYRYWATLVLREGNGTGHFLHIKEGATQVDTLSMVAYGLGTPSIIRDLRTIHPSVTQPWYADDAGAGGKISDMQHHLNEPMVRGPPWGYFTEPTKSILVLSPQNFPQAEAFFWGYGLQVVTGRRYLGGFFGTEIAQAWWLEEKVEGWLDLVSTLAGVARRHPQTAYAGL